jgi:hypothetical protein
MLPLRSLAAVCGVLVLVATAPQAQDAPAAGPMRGYSPASAAVQRRVEARLGALPSTDSIKAWHRYFTAEPHTATSPRTREIASYIAAEWKAQGLDQVVIHRYDELSSNPRRVN